MLSFIPPNRTFHKDFRTLPHRVRSEGMTEAGTEWKEKGFTNVIHHHLVPRAVWVKSLP